jgi:hypothetical protein
MYWKSFLRAIGIRQSFRRNSSQSLFNIGVAAGLGVFSGHYIFKAPLEEYWSEENREQREAQLGIKLDENNRKITTTTMESTTTTTTTVAEPPKSD